MENGKLSIDIIECYRYWKKFSLQSKGVTFPIPYREWWNRYGENCPICHGAKVGVWKDGVERYCACSTQRWLSNNEDILAPYQSLSLNMTLDQLIPLHNPPDKSDKELIITLADVKIWLGKLKSWMFIYGGRGVGKTHILQSVHTYLPKGISIYITAGDFRSKLFSAQRNDGAVDALFNVLSTVPILLYDDWGMEYQKLNDWAGATFENIIDRRSIYPERFPTIVTSNKSEDDLKASTDESTKRSISRLCAAHYSRVIYLSQADFREKTVQNAIS